LQDCLDLGLNLEALLVLDIGLKQMEAKLVVEKLIDYLQGNHLGFINLFGN
jgi:hypothetical protein